MRKLGKIKVDVISDLYTVNFSYSQVVYVDLFTYIIVNIIGKKNKLSRIKLEDTLKMIDIPIDQYYLYEVVLKELINNEFIELRDGNQDSILSQNIVNFSLTKKGNEIYTTGEIPLEKKHKTIEIFLNPWNYKFSKYDKKEITSHSNIQIDKKTGIYPNDITLNDSLLKEITDKKSYYIETANKKTVIFDFQIMGVGSYAKSELITINEENGIITFNCDNKELLDGFLSLPQSQKEKSVNQLPLPNIHIVPIDYNSDFELVGTRKIKFSIAATRGDGIINVADCSSTKLISVNSSSNRCAMRLDIENPRYSFFGLDEANKSIIANYYIEDINGYLIPLIQYNTNTKLYREYCDELWNRQLLSDPYAVGALTNIIELYEPTMRSTIITSYIDSIGMSFDNVRLYIDYFNKLKENLYGKKIQNLEEILKENIEKKVKHFLTIGANITFSEWSKFLAKFGVSKISILKILRDAVGNDEHTINVALSYDEKVAFDVFNLKKMYNDALSSLKVHTIKHNNNVLSNYINFERKLLELMKTRGWKSTYDYELPKTSEWDEYRNDVIDLRNRLKFIEEYVDKETNKHFKDYFNSFEEKYEMFAPINIKNEDTIVITGDFISDINGELKLQNPKFVGIAAQIREKYETSFREKAKLKNVKDYQKMSAREIINNVLPNQIAQTIINHWKTLSSLVHNNKEDKIVNKSKEEKRKLLKSSLEDLYKYLITEETYE